MEEEEEEQHQPEAGPEAGAPGRKRQARLDTSVAQVLHRTVKQLSALSENAPPEQHVTWYLCALVRVADGQLQDKELELCAEHAAHLSSERDPHGMGARMCVVLKGAHMGRKDWVEERDKRALAAAPIVPNKTNVKADIATVVACLLVICTATWGTAGAGKRGSTYHGDEEGKGTKGGRVTIHLPFIYLIPFAHLKWTYIH